MLNHSITINSKSSGKFTEETINNRAHLVTKMVSIEGDSVMNRIFYPFRVVAESFKQLNNLMAPSGHPKLEGQKVSAFHPTAINALNIGAFIRNPVMQGAQVINDLVIDKEVAAQTEDGKELISRVENGDQIGVSTGLKGKLRKQTGDHHGQSFDFTIDNIEFDHVALLLKDAPAGENTFTLNSQEVIICNLAATVSELQEKIRAAVKAKFPTKDFFIEEIFLEEDRVIIGFFDETTEFLSMGFSYDSESNIILDIAKEVDKHVTFNEQTKANKMKLDILVGLLIANAIFSAADKDRLLAMDEIDLANELKKKAPTELNFDDAKSLVEKKGFKVNQIDEDDYKIYAENKDEFLAFIKGKTEELEKMADHIAANSKLSKEELLKMGRESMENINNMLDPKQSYKMQGAETVENKQAPGSDNVIKLHEEA